MWVPISNGVPNSYGGPILDSDPYLAGDPDLQVGSPTRKIQTSERMKSLLKKKGDIEAII